MNLKGVIFFSFYFGNVLLIRLLGIKNTVFGGLGAVHETHFLGILRAMGQKAEEQKLSTVRTSTYPSEMAEKALQGS